MPSQIPVALAPNKFPENDPRKAAEYSSSTSVPAPHLRDPGGSLVFEACPTQP